MKSEYCNLFTSKRTQAARARHQLITISMWLCDAEDKNENIPKPSGLTDHQTPVGGFVNLVDVDTAEYRRENESRAVKKTLTIPSWLNVRAEKSGINFSQVLQEALRDRLGL